MLLINIEKIFKKDDLPMPFKFDAVSNTVTIYLMQFSDVYESSYLKNLSTHYV